jgi:L-threonylcarbamoyladenylate synthase
VVYAHSPAKSGVSMAVYNRLVRAAAFQVIEL